MSRSVLSVRALLVDDDAEFAPALKRRLGRAFEAVDVAADEATALALLEQHNYGLVIMELILGQGAGGFALCRRMKADARWRKVPIMIVSAADVRFGMSIKSCLSDPQCLPADDFLDKGTSLEQVVERARRIVERQERL